MSLKSDNYDILVIGGGFFGLNIADFFAGRGQKVLLCEKFAHCMSRASYANQARIHHGYHYPRSILTAMRSGQSFERFVHDFPECVINDFDKYYAIGRVLGKINATYFAEFCRRINAECQEVSPQINALFSPHYIEKVFKVKEYAFDATVLCRLMLKKLAAHNVELALNTSVLSVNPAPSGLSTQVQTGTQDPIQIHAKQVFNCTYANLNAVNAASHLPMIPLKYEMTEMALVEVPAELEHKSFTIMCGPFFSLMPFVDRGLYTLSHVRYTPHYEWQDTAKNYVSPLDIYEHDPKISAYSEMICDAARYLPKIRDCRYRDSIWEVKALLPASENDDSRPILFMPNHGLPHYHCVMGGKIDNVYDVIEAIKQQEDMMK